MRSTFVLKLAAFLVLAMLALVAGTAVGASSKSLENRLSVADAADCVPWHETVHGRGRDLAFLARIVTHNDVADR